MARGSRRETQRCRAHGLLVDAISGTRNDGRIADPARRGRARPTPMPKKNDRDRWASPLAYEPRLDWTGILRVALQLLGGQGSLRALNAKIEKELLPRTPLSTHSKVRIRQALKRDPMVRRVSPQVWKLQSEPAKEDAKVR